MGSTTTLNVRMDADTKERFQLFCDEVGVSASTLMNMFAKNVVRNQRVPFSLTTSPTDVASVRVARLFPSSEAELDSMLAEAESVPVEQCVSAAEGFAALERRMGW